MPPDLLRHPHVASSPSPARSAAGGSASVSIYKEMKLAERDEGSEQPSKKQQESAEGDAQKHLKKRKPQHLDADPHQPPQKQQHSKTGKTPPAKSPPAKSPSGTKSPSSRITKIKTPKSASKSSEKGVQQPGNNHFLRPAPTATSNPDSPSAQLNAIPAVATIARSLSPSPSPSVLLATPPDTSTTSAPAPAWPVAATLAPGSSAPVGGAGAAGPSPGVTRGRAALEVHKCHVVDWRDRKSVV